MQSEDRLVVIRVGLVLLIQVEIALLEVTQGQVAITNLDVNGGGEASRISWAAPELRFPDVDSRNVVVNLDIRYVVKTDISMEWT